MLFKLKPEVKEKFLTALRSGEYEQGMGALCIENAGGKNHCCLGVLTDLAAKEGVVEWSSRTDRNYTRFGIFRDGVFEASVLPFEVSMWALEGFDRDAYNRNEGDIYFGIGWRESLMAQNDFQSKSFRDIANLVEEYL